MDFFYNRRFIFFSHFRCVRILIVFLLIELRSSALERRPLEAAAMNQSTPPTLLR